MEVLEAAVHRLIKASQSSNCGVETANSQLAKGPMLNNLASSLVDTYNKRTSQRTGTFDEDEEHYPFARHLREHLNGKSNFLDLTVWALEHLMHEIKDVFFATGGYIFFAKYKVNAGEFFVVAKLNDAIGQSFSKDLTKVEAARHIPTDRLQQVGRINLEGWKAGSGKYLTFVNAREGGHSADYFVKFLGCAAPTNAKSETQKLVHLIEDYCESLQLEETKANAKKQAAFSHLISIPKGEALSLEALANALVPDNPESFIEYVNEHEDAPTDGAPLDRRSLRPLVHYVVRMDGATLKMTTRFKVEHSVSVTEDGSLVIRNVDVAKVRKQLE